MALSTLAVAFLLMFQTPAGTVEGVVKDTTGAVVAGAVVRLKGSVERQSVSDEAGRFRFEGVGEGRWTVGAERAGFAPAVREVGAGAVELVLKPADFNQALTITESLAALDTVSKLGGTVLEAPRSITVIGAEEMQARNLRSVPEFLMFMPNMAVNSYRSGGYHYYARGFRMGPDDTRVDGFAGLNVGGGFGGSLFGIEEAVVLRGPAGLLYGASGSPGGFINLVTKKPQMQRATRIDLRGGAYAGLGLGLWDRPSGSVDFDSTGAMTRGGRVLYRGLATVENQRYFTAGVLDRNRYLNGSLTFKLDEAGRYTVTPMAQMARFRRPAGGGIVISPGTSLSASDGVSGPVRTDDLSPLDVNTSGGGRLDRTSQAGVDVRATPGRGWQAAVSYRRLQMDTGINQYLPQVTTAAQIARLQSMSEVERVQSKSETERRYENVDGNVSYEHIGRGWRTTVQAGAYARVVRTRATTAQGATPAAGSALNIYTGAVASPLGDRFPALLMGAWGDTTTWNGYVQSRTSLADDRLVAAIGLGYGQNHPGGAPVQKGDAIPNASLLYRVKRGLAVYGSYATSFNPADATLENVAGVRGSFAPVVGRNYEAGLKMSDAGRGLSATLSVFKNSISNALVQTGLNDVNANGNRYYVEAGTRRGRGVELSGEGRVARDVFVTAAVSFLDSVYTGEGPESARQTLAIAGSRAEKSPRWSWSGRAHYQRAEGRLAGLGASFGVAWQAQRLGSNGARTPAAPDPLMLPSFSRVDASLFYRINSHLDWALNCENLLDRVIFVNATVGSAMEIAPPRGATMRVTYRF